MFRAWNSSFKAERLGNRIMKTQLLISVVDDDESVRESLPDLLKELGNAALTFSSREEFLVSDSILHTKYLILDIAMPGIGGLGRHRQ